MKTIYTPPTKTYPYLAVFTMGEPLGKFKQEEIVIISLVNSESGSDKKAYIQSLMGRGKAYFTEKEEEYAPLPAGYKVEIIQE